MRITTLARAALALGLTGLALAHSASAATEVYRCGQTYQQTPCPGGQRVQTPPGPTEAQQREALERAAAEQRLADQLTEDRRRQETQEAKAAQKQARRQAKEDKAAAQAAEAASAAAAAAVAAAQGSAKRVVHCPPPAYVELAPGEKAKPGKSQGACPTVVYLPSSAAASKPVALQPTPRKN